MNSSSMVTLFVLVPRKHRVRLRVAAVTREIALAPLVTEVLQPCLDGVEQATIGGPAR